MILTETSSYTPAPAGTHPARLVRIVDLGSQQTEYQGETRIAHKVLLTWEICDPDIFTDQGKPHLLNKRFTASLHEKSALRRDLAAWRGRDFTTEELARFDLEALLGKPCLLSVIHAEKDGRTFANITGASKVPKGMTVPEATEMPVHFDLADFDLETYEGLPERVQQQIAASPEYAAARQQQPTKPPATGFDDMDDDIPF